MRAEHMANDATYKNKAAEEYNMAVAEYECKIGSTQRNKDSFTWTECDTIHDWATSNDNQMEFRFHALIWLTLHSIYYIHIPSSYPYIQYEPKYIM